jgi:hypothetical protein
VAGGSGNSATDCPSEDGHCTGGDLAKGCLEVNWDSYQPPWEGPSQPADEEQLDATLGAMCTLGGTNEGANMQTMCRADSQP